MKAFLLAAGEGRRLRPLTDTTPKCLVPICGTPLLGIWLGLLERSGVTDVLINLHYRHDQVRRFLDSYPTTLRVETVYEPRLVGSAGTVVANRSFVAGEPTFLVAYADNLTRLDVGRMRRHHDAAGTAATIAVSYTDRPSEKGTVVLDGDGRITAFEEKARHPKSHLANAGVYLARPALFEYVPDRVPEDGVLDFGFHVLPRMVPNLSAYHVDEMLIDIGTLDDYAKAQTIWASQGGV